MRNKGYAKFWGAKKVYLWEKCKMVNALFRNTLFWPLTYKQLRLQTLLKTPYEDV